MPHNKVSEYFFYLCIDKKYPHNYDSISISYNQHLGFRILLHKVEYRSFSCLIQETRLMKSDA